VAEWRPGKPWTLMAGSLCIFGAVSCRSSPGPRLGSLIDEAVMRSRGRRGGSAGRGHIRGQTHTARQRDQRPSRVRPKPEAGVYAGSRGLGCGADQRGVQ
jgi:hypothetical protein